MTRDELEERNVAENLDALMTLDPRGYGVCHILYDGARKYTGEPLTLHSAKVLCDAVKPGDVVLILVGFVLLPHKVPEMDGTVGSILLARALVRAFGAKPVLVCPQAAAIILSAACSHLDGKRIAEGKSVYQGKLGTDVFSETLIVLNDPFTASDFARPFDMEGTPTEKFMAIDRGRLRCLFLNCEYAEKNGGKTNGCAGLGDACRCQYLVVTPSATGVAEMVSSMGEGLILEEIDNTRELRVDPETLDYRIPFTGWIVHEGQRQTPVSGTLLGNAAEACQKIDEISRERGDFYGCLTPWFRIPDQRAE